MLAKTLARFVNVPFVIADATTLTQVTSFEYFLNFFAEGSVRSDFRQGLGWKMNLKILLSSADLK